MKILQFPTISKPFPNNIPDLYSSAKVQEEEVLEERETIKDQRQLILEQRKRILEK
tara:strand:- start:231 stop:398 length:168 start_codon:yes stop_codon:yes gene_type:complete